MSADAEVDADAPEPRRAGTDEPGDETAGDETAEEEVTREEVVGAATGSRTARATRALPTPRTSPDEAAPDRAEAERQTVPDGDTPAAAEDGEAAPPAAEGEAAAPEVTAAAVQGEDEASRARPAAGTDPDDAAASRSGNAPGGPEPDTTEADDGRQTTRALPLPDKTPISDKTPKRPAPTRDTTEADDGRQTTRALPLPPPDKTPSKSPSKASAAGSESTRMLRMPENGVDQATASMRAPVPTPAPLELLAELTNKPAPRPTLWRQLLRRVKIYSPLTILLLLVLTAVQLLRPPPDPGLELTVPASFTFEGEQPAVPWPDSGQAVLDVTGVGTFGSSGDQEPVPIASVAKVMTAYLILRDHPMRAGGDGVDIPIDQRAETEGRASDGQSLVEVRAGDALSQRELLQAILIASANNVARLLARWDAGSEEAFVEEMNEAAAELGMADTTYTDPSGLSDDTVSTAADQVILGHAVMEDPVFREIVGVSGYTDSYGVQHGNWNYLVPVDGVVGIKPGTTSAAGGNLLFAAEQEVNGTTQRIIGAVLGQPPHPSDNSILTGALEAGEALMDFAQDALRSENAFDAGDVVGHVDDGLGGSVPVALTEDVPAIGWSGLEVSVALAEDRGGVPGSAGAGAEVGTLVIGEPDDAGSGGMAVPIELTADLQEPGLAARLLRVA